MMSSIPLSLSTKKKKKKIYKFYTLLFINIFLRKNLKNRNSFPTNYFLVLAFWKLFLKVEVKQV